jgi:phage virion morphogenesis protein
MYLAIRVEGVAAVTLMLERFEQRMGDVRPVMRRIATDMQRIESAMFTGQGRRGGGSWKRLAPSTVATKARKNQDPRILIATQALMNAASGGRNSTWDVTRTGVFVEINLPYAGIQQHGGLSGRGRKVRIPARPYFRWTEYDFNRWTKWIQSYIVNGR